MSYNPQQLSSDTKAQLGKWSCLVGEERAGLERCLVNLNATRHTLCETDERSKNYESAKSAYGTAVDQDDEYRRWLTARYGGTDVSRRTAAVSRKQTSGHPIRKVQTTPIEHESAQTEQPRSGASAPSVDPERKSVPGGSAMSGEARE